MCIRDSNAACPHVKMAHLRVAHLAFRKSHCHPAGLALYKGALAHQLVHDRSPALAHSIVVAVAVKAVEMCIRDRLHLQQETVRHAARPVRHFLRGFQVHDFTVADDRQPIFPNRCV